ncbi:hypothetical protein EKO27_g10708 [Xylaria grammica]|uniref:NmrA-like domain-containing protein n=1 Tax=Xylaria grammica TaxID=363999 RepID=A0A439CQF1_9PEZI|nr:hypothetical protein EKO27_g10708 [Xylaria grammica]
MTNILSVRLQRWRPSIPARNVPSGYTVRVLNSDPAKAEAIKKAFDGVQLVYGSLGETDIISREAASVDVVLRAIWHLWSVKATRQGLRAKPKSNKPLHWIQVPSATSLAAAELSNELRIPGATNDTVFNNLDGVDAISSLIKQYPSHAIDDYVLSAATSTPDIKTALAVGPIIYGWGRSIQIPSLSKATLQRRRSLQVNPSFSRWGNVYV